jgi:hypothetical protein
MKKPEDIIDEYRNIHTLSNSRQSEVRRKFNEFAKQTVFLNRSHSKDLISSPEEPWKYFCEHIDEVPDDYGNGYHLVDDLKRKPRDIPDA